MCVVEVTTVLIKNQLVQQFSQVAVPSLHKRNRYQTNTQQMKSATVRGISYVS
jgi:hypothetical protein